MIQSPANDLLRELNEHISAAARCAVLLSLPMTITHHDNEDGTTTWKFKFDLLPSDTPDEEHSLEDLLLGCVQPPED